MFFMPGLLISLFTFPGVIIHEMAHRFFADLAGVPVYEVCYFRLGNPSGYVIHGKPVNVKQALLISVGPLIINTILCSAITIAAIYPWFIFNSQMNTQECILIWLGLSIGMHAFPSNHDMASFSRIVKEKKSNVFLILIAKMIECIFQIANLLRFFWFDLIYAVCVTLIVPFVLHTM
jgi:hypothetical protein